MALSSWAALYTDVVRDLMARRKDPELLLLMAICGHCDPFGFCFPGKKALMTMRHCGEDTFLRRRQWLEDEGYIKYTEVYNPRRRQNEPEYQINPRCLYLREEIQEYCERVFEGDDRDFTLENNYLVTLFSTKVSQTEETESETEKKQIQKPASETSVTSRHHNQSTAQALKKDEMTPQGEDADQPGQRQKPGRTPRPQKQPAAAPQRQQAQDRDKPHVPRDYNALFQTLYYTDDETLAQELRTSVSTTIYQARQAIRDYPRDSVITTMLKAVERRDQGELSNPGGWFFKTLAATSQTNKSIQMEEEDRPIEEARRQAEQAQAEADDPYFVELAV